MSGMTKHKGGYVPKKPICPNCTYAMRSLFIILKGKDKRIGWYCIRCDRITRED